MNKDGIQYLLGLMLRDSMGQLKKSSLIPYFRENFNDVSVYFFKNKLSINNIEEFLHFYQETTYYSEVDEPLITEKVGSILNSQNKISFDKNGLLVTGRIKC